MSNQKSQGQLISQLTRARAAQKTPNAAKELKLSMANRTEPVTPQADLSHLPPGASKLAEARKLAEKHKLSVDNAPAPVAPTKAGKAWSALPPLDESTLRIMAMVRELENN
jgi:hypothetical protein